MNTNILKKLGTTVLAVGAMGTIFVSPAMANHRFSDVPHDYTFFEHIETLAQDEVIGGYGDRTFRPSENVSREAMAKFVTKGLGFEINTSCGGFTDVDTDNIFYDYIMTLKCEGVINGYSDGGFRPTNSVTRAEALTFLIKGSRIKMGNDSILPKTEDDAFPDVKSDHVHYENIMSGYSNGIVGGRNGMYLPDNHMNRGEMSKVLENIRKEIKVSDGMDEIKDDLFDRGEVLDLMDDDPFIGNKDTAQVVMINWCSYQGPFCERHYTTTHKEIVANYIDTGKLVHVYRDLQLSFHLDSARRGHAAECVDDLGTDHQYDEFMKFLYNLPSGYTSSGTLPDGMVYDGADSVGINRDKFINCFNNTNHDDEMQNDLEEAAKVGVNGTPGFYLYSIDGFGNLQGKIISGAQPYDAFQKEIDAYIND